jgi:hypothetical protein
MKVSGMVKAIDLKNRGVLVTKRTYFVRKVLKKWRIGKGKTWLTV